MDHLYSIITILIISFGLIIGSAEGVFTIDEQDGEQISSTNIGTLDVMLVPSPQFPNPKQANAFHLFFMKSDTRIPINHIDFKVVISKDGEELYSSSGPKHTHSFFDMVSFYFSTEGWHQIDVSVLGIDHEDIQAETASFTIAIGKIDEEKPSQSPQTLSIAENSDTHFTASTFFDKYQDLLQKGGQRVSVLIEVAGDVENTDPVKRAKEIRNLQSSVLKFLSFSNGVNILSNPEKNEITGQIHPHWIEILEERSDVLSVTILEQFEIFEDGEIPSPLKQIKAGVALVDIKCQEGKNLVYKYNRMRAACVSEETEGKLLSRGWAALRLGLPNTDNLPRDLCNFYEGTWIDEQRECEHFEGKLQCSLMGGTYDVCASACRNMPSSPDLMCTDNCVEVCYFEKSSLQITSFEECAAAGNPVMESYPRQCRTPDGKHFVEEIENHLN